MHTGLDRILTISVMFEWGQQGGKLTEGPYPADPATEAMPAKTTRFK
jgi:hypothetical protein